MDAPIEIFAPHCRLRLVREDDAGFVVAARQDPGRSRFLHAVADDVEQQREWIRGSLERTAAGTEYYFVAEAPADGGLRPFGLVRLSDVTADSFVFGSWVTVPDSPVAVGIESYFASIDFGFGALGCGRYFAEVRHGNARAMAFHHRMNSRMTGVTDECEQYEQTLARYLEARRRYRRYVLGDELPPRRSGR